MSIWGNTTNESKPSWTWLENRLSNVVATPQGWVYKWPWGDEVLIAIGGLTTELGVPTQVGVELVSLVLANSVSSNIAFRLLFNEPLTVNGTPTLVAISSNTSLLANVTLVYDATASDLSAGQIVFANNAANLGTGAIVSNAVTLTVNTTSVFDGSAVFDAETGNAVSNTLVIASNTVAITEFVPGLVKIFAVGALTNAAAQTVSFALDYNAGLAVTGTPTVKAISSNSEVVANLTLSYSNTLSNLTAGNLVFVAANTDLSAADTLVFTVNASSVLVGFAGIKDASGNVVQNTLLGFANTLTVVGA